MKRPAQLTSPADGSLWQLDKGDPSVGIFGDALYHDGPGATDDCRTVSQDGDVDYFEAVCSCGARLVQDSGDCR